MHIVSSSTNISPDLTSQPNLYMGLNIITRYLLSHIMYSCSCSYIVTIKTLKAVQTQPSRLVFVYSGARQDY